MCNIFAKLFDFDLSIGYLFIHLSSPCKGSELGDGVFVVRSRDLSCE